MWINLLIDKLKNGISKQSYIIFIFLGIALIYWKGESLEAREDHIKKTFNNLGNDNKNNAPRTNLQNSLDSQTEI